MKRFIKNYLRVHRRFRLLPQCSKINICLVTPFLYLFDIFDCYSYICFLDFNCKKQFKNVFFLSKMRWSHWTFPGEICATALFSIFPRISPSFLFKITGPRSSCSRGRRQNSDFGMQCVTESPPPANLPAHCMHLWRLASQHSRNYRENIKLM